MTAGFFILNYFCCKVVVLFTSHQFPSYTDLYLTPILCIRNFCNSCIIPWHLTFQIEIHLSSVLPISVVSVTNLQSDENFCLRLTSDYVKIMLCKIDYNFFEKHDQFLFSMKENKLVNGKSTDPSLSLGLSLSKFQ